MGRRSQCTRRRRRAAPPAAGPAPAFAPPEVWHDRDPSGLHVIGVALGNSPLVTLRLSLPGGRVLERPAQLGLATLTAELDIPYGPGIRNRYDLFRAGNRRMATPLAVYIHGGVWQRGDRKDYSVVADALVARGVDVALPSYSLCPEVKVADIYEELRLFMRALWRKTGRRPVVVISQLR